MISIRPASAPDNVLLSDLGRRTFAETFGPDNTPENMAAYLAGSFSPGLQAAELADPRSLFLIAEAGGEAIGYTRLYTGPAPDCVSGSRPIEIVRIYARQDFLGKGVGAALMEAALAEARRQGCDAVWLGVWEHNPRAIAFYRRWGFEKAGRHTFQLGAEAQTDFIMVRTV